MNHAIEAALNIQDGYCRECYATDDCPQCLGCHIPDERRTIVYLSKPGNLADPRDRQMLIDMAVITDYSELPSWQSLAWASRSNDNIPF